MDDDDDPYEQSVPGLEIARETNVTVDDVRLKKGDRQLTAIVDAKKTIAESMENNNELKVTVDCKDEDD